VSTQTAPDRTWLQADMPVELAEEFHEYSRRLERTARGQLRVLITDFVKAQRASDPTPTPKT
jgi:hypothetical protein